MILRFVDLNVHKDITLMLLGSYYDDKKGEIVIGLNHPIFKNVRKMLFHELGHYVYEKYYHKNKWYHFLSHERYASWFASHAKKL